MEQIPTEVMEKIDKLYPVDKSADWVGGKFVPTWNNERIKRIREGIIIGYRLASPCALCEGKEKEIAELKAEKERLKGIMEVIFYATMPNQPEEKIAEEWGKYIERNNL